MSNDLTEKLREALIDLERARAREERMRTISEALLEGLSVLLTPQPLSAMFQSLLTTMEGPLQFEDAFVLILDDDGLLKPIAATDGRFAEATWRPGKLLRRVMAGAARSVFDVSLIEEWDAQPEALREGVTSALHIPMRGDDEVAVLVCTHPERAAFGPEHLELGRRLSVLASNALVQYELRAALSAKEARLRAVVQNSPLAVWAADSEGVITEADGPAFAPMGIQPRDLIGTPIEEAFPHHESLVEDTNRALAGESVSSSLEAGGALFDTHLTPLVDDGGVRGVVGVAVDVRDRQRAERFAALNEELRQARDEAVHANQTKSAFLANMSHELRTPLNAIMGYSEMLTEDFGDAIPPQALEDILRIHHAGHQLLELIDNLLDLSRVEAGKIEIYPEEVDLDDFIAEAIMTVRPLANHKDNTLVVSTIDEPITLITDRVRLRQVLINLLTNACKFTDGGSVKLSVTPAECVTPGVRFVVADTGIGMEEDQLEVIFEPFTQVDASPTRRFGGTGLGLDITRRFVEILGGHIHVESELGVGSTFTVEIPLQLTSEAPQASERTQPRGEPLGEAPLALVIDDDDALRDLLKRTLEGEGFEVIAADNGADAVELAEAHNPAVITLDVMMPGVDGWTILDKLKSNPATHDIPVVMVTVSDERIQGFVLGAAGFVQKPFSRRKFLAELYRINDGQPTLDEERSVLVVEDDPFSRDIIVRTLERAGWTVEVAANGHEALEQLNRQRPTLILLDLMMPGMDGFAFLEAIAPEDGGDEPPPVVVLTAKELSPQEELQLARRTRSVLHKPGFSVEALGRVVASQLGH